MTASIAILPTVPEWAREAVVRGGGTITEDAAAAEGLVWVGFHDPDGLGDALASHPNLRWVQLPSAGVDDFASAGLLDGQRTWTSAKGAYAEPVAEHALALTLASLRHLPERARATSWGSPAGTSLYDKRVLVVGAGGVAQEFIRLIAPFRTHITVVRRREGAVPGADISVTAVHLREHIPTVDVIVLAAAMTSDTRTLIGIDELRSMHRDAVLVNIARGGLVDLEAVSALEDDEGPAGIALDVTEPEPLPDGHPLWENRRLLITPHSADTWDMIRPLLSERIATNIRRFAAGEPLVGVVDSELGY